MPESLRGKIPATSEEKKAYLIEKVSSPETALDVAQSEEEYELLLVLFPGSIRVKRQFQMRGSKPMDVHFFRMPGDNRDAECRTAFFDVSQTPAMRQMAAEMSQ